MKKRLLSVLLCIMVAFTVITPVVVMAEDYSDYVPGAKPADLIKDGWIYGDTNSGSVGFGWVNNKYGSDTQYTVKLDVVYDPAAQWAAHGTLVRNANVNDGTALSANTTYVFQAKFKNAGPEGTTPKFGVYYKGNTSNVFPNEYGTDGWTPGTEFTDYNITFNTGDNTSGTFVYGIMYGKAGDIVHMNYQNGMYLAEEVAYDITNVVTGATELNAGDTTTIKSEVVNQIGIPGTLDQEITYIVLNEDRTAVADGFTVIPGENGEAEVSIASTVATGKYVVLATSAVYDGFRKGAVITVENPQLVQDTVDSIKGEDAQTLAGNLEGYLEVLSVKDDYVLAADVAELAEVISGGVADEEISDKEDMQEYIRRAAIVALYNSSSEDVELYDGNGAFNYADVLKLEDIDAYEANKYVTKEGMLLVQSELAGKDFASYGEFAKAVASQIILKAISNSTQNGVEYLANVLTEENLDYIGVEADAYFALSNNVQFLRECISGKTFTNETLEATLATAYESDMVALNADFVAGAVLGNMLAYPKSINQYTPNNGNGGTMYRGEMIEANKYTLDLEKVYGYIERSAQPSNSNGSAGPSYFTTSENNARLTAPIKKGTTYVVAARLKNGAPEKKATLKAGFGYGSNVAPVRWDVTSSEFQLYTGRFTATMDATVVGLGFDATVDRRSVTDADRGMLLLDYSDSYTYIGEEYVYDLEFYAKASKVEAGTTLDIEAKAVNQVGMEYSANPEFNYYALTEERDDTAGGFAFVTSNGTKNATVEVDINTEPGFYTLMVEDVSLGVEGFKKGLVIEVTKPVIRDSEPGAQNVAITVEQGKTTVGVFDDLTLSADIVDAQRNPVAGTHEFNWYVINEERTDKIEKGFVLAPSTDTKTLVLSLEPDVPEGEYFVVAQKGSLISSIALTVDKTNDIQVIISNISNKPEKFTEDIETVVKLLEVAQTHVQNADMKELAEVVIAGAGTETLTGKDTLAEYIKRAAVVAIYNNNINEINLANEKGGFVFEKEVGLDKIDKDGITLYAAAMTEMSSEGKKLLQESLTGKDFANYAEFMKSAKENLLLVAIANPKDDGSAYIDSLITEKNLAMFEIKDSKYFDISDVSDFVINKLVKKTFTLKTLEETLNEAYETKVDSDDKDDDNKGGKKNNNKGSMSFGGSTSAPSDKNETAAAGTSAEFADVNKSHWAYTDIHYLKNIGVISGTTATTFEPDATITREQFLKLLIEAFKIGTAVSDNSFADVDTNAWYAPYVAGGVANGIINGISAEKFGVGSAVTRQDACVMLDRALSLSGAISEEISFKDAGEISDYAKTAVAALAGYGIVNGVDGGNFAPKAICTRAQAAKIISSALSISNSLNLNGR